MKSPCLWEDPSEDELRAGIRARLGPRPLPALDLNGFQGLLQSSKCRQDLKKAQPCPHSTVGAALWRPVTCS